MGNEAIEQGIKDDASEYKSFLQGIGGAWAKDEIISIDFNEISISQESLKTILNDCRNLDYCIVAFFGHGYLTRDEYGFNVIYLMCNFDFHIPEYEFKISKRNFLLLDCCRKLEESRSTNELLNKISAYEKYDFIAVRKLYEEAIERSEKGSIQIYFAEQNESKNGIQSFTRCFIEACEIWVQDQSNFNILYDKQAVENATLLLHKYSLQQSPVYNAGRRIHHFPVVISCPNG